MPQTVHNTYMSFINTSMIVIGIFYIDKTGV